MKSLRLAAPLALAAVVAAGCFLVSGQFVVTYKFATPITVTSGALTSIGVDLTTDHSYNDHKSDIKDVTDLALIGKITNTGTGSATVEIWMAPLGSGFTTAAAVRGGGKEVWGPLTLAMGASENVDWDRSSTLFVGRQALIDKIKGDGKFDLYLISSADPFALKIENGALIAVVSAAK